MRSSLLHVSSVEYSARRGPLKGRRIAEMKIHRARKGNGLRKGYMDDRGFGVHPSVLKSIEDIMSAPIPTSSRGISPLAKDIREISFSWKKGKELPE